MSGLIKIVGDDIWNPNNWAEDEHENRIYVSGDLSIYAVVDWIDYVDLVRYKWSVHAVKGKPQPYLRRTITEFWGPEGERYVSPISGKLVRNLKRMQRTLFLHQEIAIRAGKVPPTPDHKIVDHRDRNTLNCRRYNLEYATFKENAANRTQDGKNLRNATKPPRLGRESIPHVPPSRQSRPNGGNVSL